MVESKDSTLLLKLKLNLFHNEKEICGRTIATESIYTNKLAERYPWS
jgi:hypothetical protein